jgi:uncharacterized NAD(P)/FAD-binding protein YdhS
LRKQDPSLEAVREAADRMRPELPSLWRSWDSKARAFFMRHLKAYWEVIRHRAPIPVLEDIASERAQGNVETLAGSIQSIEKKHGQYEVSFRRRRGTQIETLCVDRVFDATGAKIRRDFSGEHLRQDPFGFGYEKCSGEGIFLIGPPAKGIHWECTAVPEIRLQADEIVKQFKEKLA